MGAAQGGDHKSRMCRTCNCGHFGKRITIIGRQMPETMIKAPRRLGQVVKREDTGIGDRQVRDARWAAASVRCHCRGTSHETLPFANLRNVESQGPSPHLVGLHIGARSERRHHPTASGRGERDCGEHYWFQAIACPVVALLEARVRCARHRSQTPRCRAHVCEQCGCMGGRWLARRNTAGVHGGFYSGPASFDRLPTFAAFSTHCDHWVPSDVCRNGAASHIGPEYGLRAQCSSTHRR